jgi:hypothetical protein
MLAGLSESVELLVSELMPHQVMFALVNEAAEQLAVGVRAGRADAGLCPAVSFS